jgi:hypothetical protein
MDSTYHIVVSRWKRNTDWVELLPLVFFDLQTAASDKEIKGTEDLESEIENICKIIIYDKECPENPHNIPVNQGNEAAVYLKYIIDYYEALPDYVFFIHDEEYSWHHTGSLYDRFKEAIVLKKRFYNINHFTMQSLHTNIYVLEILRWYHQYIEPYIPLDSLPDPDFTIGHKGAAQFMVHKEAILHLPKSFYSGLYDWVMNSGESSFVTGRFLEWTWHIFWGDHIKTRFLIV